jgi:predicted CXXCH cytochrome family protein
VPQVGFGCFALATLAISALLVATIDISLRQYSERTQRSDLSSGLGSRRNFVLSEACANCHRSEFENWLGSHHRLAMRPATVGSVLGNFAGTTFADNAGATTFFCEGGKFMLRTAGPDGKLHQYQVKFTFGVSPLQQYLVELPGGRLQAFDVAWDSRPPTKGGQRWFSLNPHSKPGPAALAQWATIDQNWNSMCADCHSTNVRKNYDSSGRTYDTTYAEVDVGCEACHGPGSAHIAWAKLPSDRRARDPSHGLTVSFDQRIGIGWTFDSESNEVRRSRAPSNDREVETCARCHSRRTEIHEDYVHGQSLGDDYRVAMLDDGLYFPDGQIEGEVYEYGSFVQSRMFHEGVTCSDCHDPHSLRLRAEGNSLCTRCHIAARYDSPRHHFHATGSAGARCIDCHMPARTYMLIDRRHDHSFRVPRPDLSIALGTPNTCNDCHSDNDPSWAEAQIRKWYSKRSEGFQRFGSALFAGRRGAPGAGTTLTQLALDSAQPAIARATALAALADLSQQVRPEVLARSSKEKSEVIRRGAADMLASANPEESPAIARLLNDRPFCKNRGGCFARRCGGSRPTS